jgi:catechol 2,3-dioxygenase-like lactoylglutathione lyase family enzyme
MPDDSRTGSAPVSSAATTERSIEQAVPFFWVRDMEASLRFYVDGLGFARAREWVVDGRIRWCWLELGGAAIMLQELRRDGHGRVLPEPGATLGVNVCFICRDAIAVYRAARSRGMDPKRPFVGNAMWVTELADPDGYQLFFESPTDAAEETVLAE